MYKMLLRTWIIYVSSVRACQDATGEPRYSKFAERTNRNDILNTLSVNHTLACGDFDLLSLQACDYRVTLCKKVIFVFILF